MIRSGKLPDDSQMTFSQGHMQTSPTTAVSLEYTEKQGKGRGESAEQANTVLLRKYWGRKKEGGGR